MMDLQTLLLLTQAMQKDDGTAGMEQELGAYDAMGPEGFERMTGMGTLDQRGALAQQGMQGELGMLGQQMGQAQDFAQPVGKNYGSVGGNIAGGIGDVLRQFMGGRQMADIRGKQDAALQKGMSAQQGILGQQDQGRYDVGSARIDALRQFMAMKKAQQQQQPVGPQAGPTLPPGY